MIDGNTRFLRVFAARPHQKQDDNGSDALIRQNAVPDIKAAYSGLTKDSSTFFHS